MSYTRLSLCHFSLSFLSVALGLCSLELFLQLMPPFQPSIFPFLLPMFGVVSETQDPVVKFCISLLQMPVAVRVCVCTTIQSIHQEAVSYISLFPWKFFVIGFERCGSTDEAHPFTLLPAHTLAHKQPAR